MEFFIAMNPPTVTAQMKQVRVVGNKPIFYDPPKVKEARQSLSGHLAKYKPLSPIMGGCFTPCDMAVSEGQEP